MQKCAACGLEFELQCPACGDSSVPSKQQTRKTLNNYSLLLAPGLQAGFFAYLVSIPLDAGPLLVLGICILMVPLLMQLWSIVKKRQSEDLARLRTAYLYSSIVLLLLALLPLLNGWLDKSPARSVKTTVVRKTSYRHRSGSSYYITVSSWRPGKSDEELRVGSRLYSNVVIGKSVTVEVHKGFFGLPWMGDVSSK
jgi:hypothetical protein